MSARRSPRVLQLVLSLNPGGTERLVLELVKRLHSDLPMAVCCLDERGAWAPELESRGIAVEELRRGPGFRPALGRAVAAAARRHDADVVHCHHYSPFIYGCLARVWRRGLQVVFTEHGRLSDAKPSRKRRVANGLFARVPSGVFAVSGDLRAHLIEEGFPAGAVRVIYNGIEAGPIPREADRAAVRQRLGVEPGEVTVIGTIARLDPVKDLGTLCRAMVEVRHHRRAMLIVVGEGPERGPLEALVRDLDLHDAVRFLGARNDARAWLAGCDVYVNSSISEGVSLTILEAMAAALPIVATKVGGTPEVVHESCGRLIAPRSPAPLAGALLELSNSAALRDRLGREARRRVEATFSLDRMVREYREVYSALA